MPEALLLIQDKEKSANHKRRRGRERFYLYYRRNGVVNGTHAHTFTHTLKLTELTNSEGHPSVSVSCWVIIVLTVLD